MVVYQVSVACVEKLQALGKRATATPPKAVIKPYSFDSTWD
ncbi:hypothetical protein RintRC_7585 [Richelia intracellularis]|nr:hypothetical protein RintRC_7585 [Richelia intracellularis]